MAMLRRPILLLVAATLAPALLVGGDATSSENETPPAYTSVPYELPPGLSSQRPGLNAYHRLGDELKIGDLGFQVVRQKGQLRIAEKAGAPAARVLRLPETVTLHTGVGAKRVEYRVHVRKAPGPKLEYALLGGRKFEFRGWEIVLVDADGDGRFVIGKDAYTNPGNTMLLPLGKELIVGFARYELLSLEPDGSSLTATESMLAGSERQLEALLSINRRRRNDGLPPMTVDLELSAACTSHAEYLAANGWNTYTNPHSEDPERDGYTEEGDAAARRSLIMGGVSDRYAVDAFWRTFYHRVDFLHPGVRRVGISNGPTWITVIDASGAGQDDASELADGYRDPILSPADGANSFDSSFCSRGESPEPVPSPRGRGNPLIVSFTDGIDIITNFGGRLVELTEEGEVAVPVLVARSVPGVDAYALVPERRLKPRTSYRVTFTYENDDQPGPTVLTSSFTTH